HRRLLHELHVVDLDRQGEVLPRRKRRIDVDEIDVADELLEEPREDVLLVAPDQAVAPVLLLATAEKIKRALSLLSGLVDRLDRLKRQRAAQWRDPPPLSSYLPCRSARAWTRGADSCGSASQRASHGRLNDH